MSRRTTIAGVLLTIASLIAGGAGCGTTEPFDESSGTSRPATGARTLPIPTLPDAAGAGAQATRPPGLLDWDVPRGWVAQPPQSSMRIAQYAVPGPGGEATCIVYYFGPGQGGDPMANAARWAGQFTQADGTDSRERMSVETIADAPLPTRLVAVRGTYDGGMSMTDQPAATVPNAMLLGGIAEGPDAPWFFKLTGPESTVAAQREALIGLLRSLRAAQAAG